MSYILTPDPGHPGYVAGRNYATRRGLMAAVTIAAIDLLYCVPFILVRPITFTNGMIFVTTGGAGSSVKGGIWATSAVTPRPLGAPLYADNTGVATTSSSAKAVLAFGAGGLAASTLYWFCMKTTGTPPAVMGSNVAEADISYLAGTVVATNGQNNCWVSFADTYLNALPTLAEGATFTANNTFGMPLLYLTT